MIFTVQNFISHFIAGIEYHLIRAARWQKQCPDPPKYFCSMKYKCFNWSEECITYFIANLPEQIFSDFLNSKFIRPAYRHASLMILPSLGIRPTFMKKSHLPPFFFSCLFTLCVYIIFLNLLFYCVSWHQLSSTQRQLWTHISLHLRASRTRLAHCWLLCLQLYPSDNLISLSFSMPAFSANLFRLFQKVFW